MGLQMNSIPLLSITVKAVWANWNGPANHWQWLTCPWRRWLDMKSQEPFGLSWLYLGRWWRTTCIHACIHSESTGTCMLPKSSSHTCITPGESELGVSVLFFCVQRLRLSVFGFLSCLSAALCALTGPWGVDAWGGGGVRSRLMDAGWAPIWSQLEILACEKWPQLDTHSSCQCLPGPTDLRKLNFWINLLHFVLPQRRNDKPAFIFA